MNNDDRYFSDEWQALPEKGYTHMFENMLKSPNIDVALEVDYFKVWIFISINADWKCGYADKLILSNMDFEYVYPF